MPRFFLLAAAALMLGACSTDDKSNDASDATNTSAEREAETSLTVESDGSTMTEVTIGAPTDETPADFDASLDAAIAPFDELFELTDDERSCWTDAFTADPDLLEAVITRSVDSEQEIEYAGLLSTCLAPEKFVAAMGMAPMQNAGATQEQSECFVRSFLDLPQEQIDEYTAMMQSRERLSADLAEIIEEMMSTECDFDL